MRVLARNAVVILLLAVAVMAKAGPAVAEHRASPATAHAITRALETGPVRIHVHWIHVSSYGPYALVYVSSPDMVGYFLMHERDRRWHQLSVISDEGLRCDEAPRAVIRDLDLLRYADAGRCSGPYRR